MCRAAVSRGSGVENKLPQVLNAGVGLFASLTCFYCFALVLFLCATPLSSLSPSPSSSPSCRVKCPPGPQPILYLEYKESSAAFDPPVMKFFCLSFGPSSSLNLNSMLSVTSSSLQHSQHESEGAGPVRRRALRLPPSQRADCLATTNQPNIFGRV